ncbi:MAG: PhzF family phenazine biosynthesis isomerase, partial [Proteobacteria bacterium]|nr:PhzF family phenazine biosynthesis isomerase [Pseudomonadota bacterium]
MDVNFVTLDVFTSRTFGGNPLAVITDARNLTTEQMQAIAAEFNHSESTFVLPPEDPSDTAVVRIFMPTQEIPFAGHPNVGTAVALARAGEAFGKPIGDVVRFQEQLGVVEIEIIREAGVAV